MMNLFSIGNPEGFEHPHKPFRSEETHQVILQRNEELGLSGIALSSGTSTELIINTSRFMTFRTDDVKSSGCSCLFIELDIRTTTCHVRRNRYRPMYTGFRNDGRFLLMELRIQNIVLNAPSLQLIGKQFGSFNRNGTHENRCPGFMNCFNLIHYGIELFFFCFVYRIIQVYSLYRPVRRNLDDVHRVNISELLLLCLCRTGHTGFLFELIEEVLEGNGCQRSGLSLHLHVFLRFNCLVQTVGITPSVHDTSGKFVDNQNLVILHNIVHIPLHQVVRPKGKNDIVLDFQILGIRQVIDMKIFLYLLHTLLGQVYGLFLLVYDEITGLLDFLSKDGIDFREFRRLFSSFELSRQNIAKLIELRGFSRLTGNNERRSRFIDQNGVHLIDDAVV